MTPKYGIFIFLLLFIIFLLGLKNYEVWTHPLEIKKENETLKKPERTPETPSAIPRSEIGTGSITSSLFIAEKNIFSPERKEFPIQLREQSKPLSRPQIILYGVTISEGYQSATVANPGRPLRKEERETFTLRIGERVGEYKLASILPDRITMESSGDSYEVLLYDPRTAKRRIDTTKSVASIPAPPISPKEGLEEAKETAQEKIIKPPPDPTGPPRPTFPSALHRRRGLYTRPSGR
jgi:hypothetical protein